MDQHIAIVLIALFATQVLSYFDIILAMIVIGTITLFMREARAHSESVRADLDKTRGRLSDSERALDIKSTLCNRGLQCVLSIK